MTQNFNPQPPVRPFATDRGLLKYLIFSLLTLGIYSLVVMYKVSDELNTVARNDGRHTMNYLLAFFIFSPLTCGIYSFIWWTNFSERMGSQLRARNIDYSFGAGSFWGWNILGALLFGIGPFVFIHKLFKASNLLNADYNARG